MKAQAPSPAPAPGQPQASWRALLDALGEAAWLVDLAALQVCAVNQDALALLGRNEAQVLGQAADSLIATPEDGAYWQVALQDATDGRLGPLHSDVSLLRGDGSLLPVTRRIRPLALDAAAPPRHCLVLLRDRSVQQRESEERELLLAELQATLESTADGILVTDLAGRIRAFNRRFAQIWGLPESLLVQRQDAAVLDWMRRSVPEPEAFARRMACIQNDTLLVSQERLVLHSGQVLEQVSRPQYSQGRPCGRVWSFRDMTELVQAGQRIEALATSDTLTGLINRQRMVERVDEALRLARRDDTGLALLLLDLDRFKQLNDSLGHEIGDRVLLEVADRLSASLRQGDVVARMAGDQFAVLAHDSDGRGAESAARRMIDAVSAALAVDGLQFTLTCSIGIAMFPTDAADAQQLLRHAETAVARAKQGGRSCFRFHQPEHVADLRHRMRLDHAMRQALAGHRFRLHYQPQVNLRTGEVIGAEALIRWHDPELGEVSPGQFIPVAEDTGFIVPIGDWVLVQAVRQAAAWRAQGLHMPVSVNVSALQFQQAGFIERVAEVLHEHGLPGELLELELTESILIHEADEALARLSQLKMQGIRLAIDDFGTGYSSLSYLKRFPIDRLKIDRSFVGGVPADLSGGAIVRAIVQMALALGMKVIAEGVETEPQRRFLAELGCDEFQGFLYAPALDAAAFAQRIQGHDPAGRRPRLSLVRA